MAILIVEDDELLALDMERLATGMNYGPVHVCSSSKEAIKLCAIHDFHVVLMDINIQGNYDGIELAEMLSEDNDFELLFVTSQNDQLSFKRASRSMPSGFLLKPFSEQQFKRTLELTLLKYQQRTADLEEAFELEIAQDNLFIKKRNEIIKVLIEDILYIMADGGKYCKIITESDLFIVRRSLKSLAIMIQNENFVQCHRSYIVNIKKITRVDLEEDIIKLKDNEIPMSRRERDNVLSKISYL